MRGGNIGLYVPEYGPKSINVCGAWSRMNTEWTSIVQEVASSSTRTTSESFKRRDKCNPAFMSGFKSLDDFICGLNPGNVYTVTTVSRFLADAFLVEILKNNALSLPAVPMGVFCLSSPPSELALNLITSVLNLSAKELHHSFKLLKIKAQYDECVTKISEAPIYYCDKCPISLGELKSEASRLVKSAGVKILIINSANYIVNPQMPYAPYTVNGVDAQRTVIARQIKELSMSLGVPIIVTLGVKDDSQCNDAIDSFIGDAGCDPLMYYSDVQIKMTYSSQKSDEADFNIINASVADGYSHEMRELGFRFNSSVSRLIGAGFVPPAEEDDHDTTISPVDDNGDTPKNDTHTSVTFPENDDLNIRELILKKAIEDDWVAKATCYISFLYKGDSKTQRCDPPDGFITRFDGMSYTVKKLSQYKSDEEQSKPYLPGYIYSVEIVQKINNKSARVRYSMYGGLMFGAGYEAVVELKDDKWVVTSEQKLWTE